MQSNHVIKGTCNKIIPAEMVFYNEGKTMIEFSMKITNFTFKTKHVNKFVVSKKAQSSCQDEVRNILQIIWHLSHRPLFTSTFQPQLGKKQQYLIPS